MKRFFPIVISTVVVLANFGCTKTDENSNLSNVNVELAATPVASSTASNANAAVVSNEPVPTFSDAETALAEGNKYFDANATEKAIEAYKQAVKLNPDLAEAYFKLGISYTLIENEKDALQVVGETPTPTPGKAKKGKKEDEKVAVTDSDKAFEKAAKAYEKIIDKDPKNDVAHFNLGRSYNKLNKDKEAEKALRQAVKLKPDDIEYQTEFGAILVKLSNYDEAVTALKKAVALDDTNSQAQELLEKAEAGKKRIDFGVKAVQQQMENSRQKNTRATKPKSDGADGDGDVPPATVPPAPKPTV
jgi:tetratricopeptide (TPR) repeat protein